MDDLMRGTWHVACWWAREDGVICVFFLHHGHMFYYRADDHTTLHKESLTQATIERLIRLPKFSYSEPDKRWATVIGQMDNMLGIKPEPKPEPVRVEAPEPIVESPKLEVRVRRPERGEGQMRLF